MQSLALFTLLPLTLAFPAIPLVPPIPAIPAIPLVPPIPAIPAIPASPAASYFPDPQIPARCICEPRFCIQSFPDGCICANNNAIACYKKCGGPFPTLSDCTLHVDPRPFPTKTLPLQTLPIQTLPIQTLPIQTLSTRTLPIQTLPFETVSILPLIPAATLPVKTLQPATLATLPVLTLPVIDPVQTLPIQPIGPLPIQTFVPDPAPFDPFPVRPRPSPIKAECGSLNLPGCPLAGQECVRIPGASCGPEADCGGICMFKRYIFCGGFAGVPCPKGLRCVDDLRDGCDPRFGGADCGGICVK